MNTINYKESDAEDEKLTTRQFHDQRIRRFPERLKKAIGSDTIRGFARKSGLSDAVLHSYLSGNTFPTLDRLDAIASAAGVAPEWLLAGPKEDSFGGVKENPEKYATVNEAWDPSLLKDVVFILEELEAQEDEDWGPAAKAELVIAVYEYLYYEENPSPEDRERVFKLIKSIVKGVSNVKVGGQEGESGKTI